MPEDDTATRPPAPKYTPAPYLIKSSGLTADELISCYKDFYDNLKDPSTTSTLVFERLVANLAALKPPATKDPAHDSCLAALDKSRDENKTLKLGMDQLKAELATAQKGLITAQKDLETTKKELETAKNGLTTTQKDLATAQKDLETAKKDLEATNEPLNTVIVETTPSIGNFHNPDGAPKDITFPKPYLAAPAISVGIRGIHTAGNNLSVATYATNIRKDSFRIHCGEKGNTAHSSWLVMPPNYPGMQCGTVSVKEGDPVLAQNEKTIKITFPRPYKETPKIETYFSGLDLSASSGPYLTMVQTNETPTGFTINIFVSPSTILRKCTMSWIAYPKDMPRIWSHSQELAIADRGKVYGYLPFGRTLFLTPPRIMFAIRGIYMSSAFNGGTITTDSSKDDADGVQWEVVASDGVKIHSLTVCFIALGN